MISTICYLWLLMNISSCSYKSSVQRQILLALQQNLSPHFSRTCASQYRLSLYLLSLNRFVKHLHKLQLLFLFIYDTLFGTLVRYFCSSEAPVILFWNFSMYKVNRDFFSDSLNTFKIIGGWWCVGLMHARWWLPY